MLNIETILDHYVVAALWSTCDDEDNPLDDNYSIDDIAPDTLASMVNDVADFVAVAYADLVKSGQTEEQIGHDFWLTRNGHGAGFWDRGLGDIGERLTRVCKVYGSVDLCVDTEGKIHA